MTREQVNRLMYGDIVRHTPTRTAYMVTQTYHECVNVRSGDGQPISITSYNCDEWEPEETY